MELSIQLIQGDEQDEQVLLLVKYLVSGQLVQIYN